MKTALIISGILLLIAVYFIIRIVLVAIIFYADTLKRKGLRK